MITVSDFYKDKFGCKVYKLSLDASCTCPNRDGTKGSGGCIFCSARGSGDFAADREKSITEQLEEAKCRVESKLKGKSGRTDGKYIAYFQNFTNTYGNADRLEKLYREAIAHSEKTGVVGLAIATRPDCLSDDMISRIARLCEQTFVTVELGLQTANDNTATLINRCYQTIEYDAAVKKLHEASCGKIHVVTHVIFGLPTESENNMLETVRHVVKAGSDGIKFTVLHVLKGTKLFELYQKGEIKCLSKDEYFDLLYKAIQILPKNIVIHRLTGDGDKKILVAPLWTANKRQVRNEMSAYFRRLEASQSNIESPSS